MLNLHQNPGVNLAAHHMDPGVLRPYQGANGKSFVTILGKAEEIMVQAALRKDEWITFDEAIVRATRSRLTGVDMLNSRGLTFNLDGMMKTVLETENQSDMTEAQLSMDGLTPAEKDRLNFEIVGLPLPITSKDFHLSSRVLGASRAIGQPLDTSTIESCVFKVKEKVETMLFLGASAFKSGGYTLRGFTDFAQRNTASLTANWDDSAATGAVVLADVLAWKATLISKGFYGPYGIFIPQNFETPLDEDFKANGELTIRDRLMKITGLEFIQVADKLTADNVIMFQLTSDVARMVNGMGIVPVEWNTLGGMSLHFKVMTIQVPQIRADQEGNCGVLHAS